MVSYKTFKVLGDGTEYVEGFCKSTDTKPTDNIANGSSLFAIDTGATYYFDASTESWGVPTPA